MPGRVAANWSECNCEKMAVEGSAFLFSFFFFYEADYLPRLPLRTKDFHCDAALERRGHVQRLTILC